MQRISCTQLSVIFSYKVNTTALEGSVSTPYFKQPFDEKSFRPIMKFTLYIYVPESLKSTNKSIVINIEYDLAEAEINYNEYCAINFTKLDRNEKNARMTYSVADYVYRITYNRRLQEITHWKTRRNIGINVTWYYAENTDNKYLDDNKMP